MSQNGFKIKRSLNLQPVALGSLITPQNGDIACDILDNKIKYYDSVSSSWKLMGGGSPSLDVVFQLYADEPLASWNTTALQGGTFVKETVTPLHGDASYKFTRSTSSSTAIFISPVQAVDLRFRGKVNSLYFPYSYNGLNDIVTAQLYDNTNSAFLGDAIPLNGTNGAINIAQTNVTIPLTCTSVSVVFTLTGADNSKVLQFDDIQLTSDVSIVQNIGNITDWKDYTMVIGSDGGTAPTLGGTIYINSAKWRRVGGNMEIVYIFAKAAGGTSGTNAYTFSIPPGYNIDYSVVPSAQGLVAVGTGRASGVGLVGAGGTSPALNPIVPNSLLNKVMLRYPFSSVEGTAFIGAGGYPLSGEVSYSFQISIPILGWSASSPMIVTPTETFSSDTAALTYASSSQYTLATLANAPVGTFITFTYAGGSNTRTQTTAAPTQTTTDMNTNGIQLFSRAYGAISTTAKPACVAIQIGKGMKGISNSIYKSTGRTTIGSVDKLVSPSSDEAGLSFKDYTSETGILILDVGYCYNTSTSNNTMIFSDNTKQPSGYLVINASKSPALTGVTLPKRYIVRTFQSGADWYEVYNDGWVRQGNGATLPLNQDYVVTLIINMKDTNYSAIRTLNSSSATQMEALFYDIRKTSTSTVTMRGYPSSQTSSYIIEGYASASALAALGVIVPYV